MTQMREKTSAEDLQHRAQWKNLHLYHYKKTPYAVCSRYVYIIVCYTRMFIYIFKNHCIPLYNHIIILRTYLYLYIYMYTHIYIYITYVAILRCSCQYLLSIASYDCQRVGHMWPVPLGKWWSVDGMGPSFTPILLVSYTNTCHEISLIIMWV